MADDIAREIARLRAELAEAQRRTEEAQRKQEVAERRQQEEQRLREEEQRRRGLAEQVAGEQNLAHFLESCHTFCKKIRPVDDPGSVTRGFTTDPASSLFPQTIALWDDFGERQQRTWTLLGDIDELWHTALYPSIAACKSIEAIFDPIGSEDDLRFLQRLTVDNMVKEMYNALMRNYELAPSLLGHGQISFENPASFRGAEMSTLSDTMGDLAIRGTSGQQPRNTRADQFCVLWREDGSVRPLIAIEYKAPHKLTIEEICTGLQSEIQPERDVIGQDESNSFVLLCRRLLTAVITQLFSYMIDKCVRYGYVCTGEAYIFLRIPDDPTTVYFSVNIPKKDYEVDVESRLQRTAVSQVFAFIQQALSEEPPSQAWIDDAKARRKRWKVEFVDALATIPETERQSKEASEYRTREWRKGMRPSPIRLRSQCGEQVTHSTSRGHQEGPSQGRNRTRIQDRAYCSHRCLLGLCRGLAIDRSCPNARKHLKHGAKHMLKDVFLRHVRHQLATDRGSAANCCPLFVHGSRGALLKVHLNVGGYTLVAKAMVHHDRTRLKHEAAVYDRLQRLQGRYVPVCCGTVELQMPYHYDGVELKHILLLSWAGTSLAQLRVQDEQFASIQPSCDKQIRQAYEAIEALQVLHQDAAPRNMVYNDKTGQLMIIDFERSEIVQRPALLELSPNRKRKQPVNQQGRKADHGEELGSVPSSLLGVQNNTRHV